MRLFSVGVAAIAGLLVLTGAASPPDGTLSVRVTNIRNGKGVVHVNLCPEARFLKPNCPYSAVAPARIGTTIVTVRGVPAGQFAAQVFHDENGNEEVDRALFGLPKEGVGFSNDARITFGPPKWKDAQFAFSGRDQMIQLKMRYFLGASGPPAG